MHEFRKLFPTTKKREKKKKKERRKSISHNTETDLPGRRRHPKNSAAVGTRSNMRKLLHLNYTKPSNHAEQHIKPYKKLTLVDLDLDSKGT